MKYPDWKLVIIGESKGEGNLKAQLISLAEELGLKLYDGLSAREPSFDDDIFLLDFQANPFRFMRQSRLLLFPSVFEGFPNTLLEAMQSGLPVIAADCHSGPREILLPDADLEQQTIKMEPTPYGILCPVLPSQDIGNGVQKEITNEWMNAVDLLIGDKELRGRIIQNGYKRVKDFDKNAILGQWEDSIAGR